MEKIKASKIISTVGVLGVASVGTIISATSCSNDNPNDDVVAVIDSKIDSKYLITEGSSIYTRYSDSTLVTQTKLLDLQAYAADNKNAKTFEISETINFGILLNFDQEMKLRAVNNAKISLGSAESKVTGDVWGVIVGSAKKPASSVAARYSKTMSIDATVHAELYTNDDAYGIFIDGTDVNSIQEINGTFNIDAQNGYGVYYNEVCRGNTIVNGSFLISGVMKAIGVDFPTTIQKSKQTINGNFVLNTSSQSISQDNTIIGVFFYNDVNSIVNINGTFEINSFTIGIGVYFQEEVLESSRITTKGTFDVNAGFYGYGYRFNKGIYNGAYIEIDGFAKVKSNTANPGGLPTEPEACAIYFNSNLESNLLINGTFLVNAVWNAVGCLVYSTDVQSSTTINGIFDVNSTLNYAAGVRFYQGLGGDFGINGNFTIHSDNNSDYDKAYGLDFNYTENNSALNVAGIFTINSENAKVIFCKFNSTVASSTQNFSGIHTLFSSKLCSTVPIATAAGVVTTNSLFFFSNKADSSSIFSKYPDSDCTYSYNGTSVTKDTPATADVSLTLSTLKDSQEEYSMYVINADGKDGASKTLFNTAIKTQLMTYAQSSYCSEDAKIWLIQIIDQIII